MLLRYRGVGEWGVSGDLDGGPGSRGGGVCDFFSTMLQTTTTSPPAPLLPFMMGQPSRLLLFFSLGFILAAGCAFVREYTHVWRRETLIECGESSVVAEVARVTVESTTTTPSRPIDAPSTVAGAPGSRGKKGDALHTNESPTLDDGLLPRLVEWQAFPLLKRNCSSFCVDLVTKCGTSALSSVLHYPHEGHRHFIRDDKSRLTMYRNGGRAKQGAPCECRFGTTRDPIDRLISAYEYDRDKHTFDGPFHEFISKGMTRNPHHLTVYESYLGGSGRDVAINVTLVLSSYDLLIPTEYLSTILQYLRLRVTELEPLPYVPLADHHSSGIPAHRYPLDALSLDALQRYLGARAHDTQVHQLARAIARPLVLEMDQALREMHEAGRTYL